MKREQASQASYVSKNTTNITVSSPLSWGWILLPQLFETSCRFRRRCKIVVMASILIFSAGLVFMLISTPHETQLMEHQMAERSARVAKVCTQHSTSLLHQYSMWLGTPAKWSAVNQSLSYPKVLVYREQSLIWCKVPKVASTSLVHSFLRILGRNDLIEYIPRGQLHVMLSDLLPPPSPQEDLSSFIAFMVVRHPFQRVLSAYRDKFLNRLEHSQFIRFQNQYGLSIIQNYRRHRQMHHYRDVPTFREFVEYLIATPVWKYDQHWLPYYLTCAPCHQRYSIIMKLNSVIQESEYLVHITGLPELNPKHIHATINNSYTHSSSGNEDKLYQLSDFQVQHLHRGDRINGSNSAIESMFFSELDTEQLMKLYSVYKIDFEMFDFDITPYDTYVKINKKT